MFGTSAFAAAPFAALGSNAFNAYIDEAAGAVDTFVARMVYPTSMSETATISDAASVAASIFTALVLEASTGSETVTVAASSFGASILELGTASDSMLVAPSTFGASVAETAAAQDLVAALVVFFCVVQEASTALDAIAARLLWEVINDSQNASWQTINAAQSTTWTTINDSVPNTWSDIPTLD
jgi:hypothetical protein